MAYAPLNKKLEFTDSKGKKEMFKWKKSFAKSRNAMAMAYVNELKIKKYKVAIKRTPTGIIDIYARK